MPREYIQESVPIISQVPFTQIVLFDDFNDGLLWGASGTGTDYCVELNSGLKFSGKYCLYLKTRYTVPAADDVVSTSRSIMIVSRGIATLDVIYSLHTPAAPRSFQIDWNNVISGIRYPASYQYIVADQKWQFSNSAAAWQDIPGASMNVGYDMYIPISMSINLDTKKYVHFTFMKNTCDLSDENLWSGTSILPDYTGISFSLYTLANVSKSMSIDLVQLSLKP